MPTCQDARYIIVLYSEDEDGAVTDRINLADGASYGVGPGAVYAPPPKQKVASGANSLYRHGSDVVRVRYNNSTVEIRELTITGTVDILAERIMRITTMLEKARLRQERGWGEKVFIERDWRYSTYYTWDVDPAPEYFYETVDVLKKEVYRGDFIPPREDVGAILRDGALAPCRLNLECYPFWQGRERVLLIESQIENHYCPSDSALNYINISGQDLPGDAPCLLRFRIRNISGAVSGIRQLRMGIKRNFYPVNSFCCDDLTYQTEDSDIYDGDTASFPAVPPDADFSCGEGARTTPSTNTNVVRLAWQINGNLVPRGVYKPYLRIRVNETSRVVLAQFVLTSDALETPFYTGPQVEVLNHSPASEFVMVDLGLFEVPPKAMGDLFPPQYFLQIFLQSDAASGTIDTDYLLLLPVEGGMKLIQVLLNNAGTQANFQTDIALELNGFGDPPLSLLYDSATGAYRDTPSDDLGVASYIEPGQDHCIIFSADEWNSPEDLPRNMLATVMGVEIAIIPQYLYIR